MSVLDEAGRLAAQGRRQEGIDLVTRSAEAGDPEALFAVANWRLFGLYGAQDPAEAHKLLDRAVGAGSEESVLLKANLLASGVGCAADEDAAVSLLKGIAGGNADAARQIDLLEQMGHEEEWSASTGEMLCASPHIRVVRNLLSLAECDFIKERAERHLRPSFINHPTTGQIVPHPTRTSFGMSFGPSLEDAVVHRINLRIAKVSGTDPACGEPLQILRYEPGQEYRPHLDAIAGEPNKRAWTVLTYLNDDYEGGTTRFDELGVDFRGETGDALIFSSIVANGDVDWRARHAGLPITAGVKWLATRWIRQAPIHPAA